MFPLLNQAFGVVFRNPAYIKDLSFFKQVSIFHGLSSRQLGRVIRILQKRDYAQNEILFKEGSLGKAVFVIRSGKVQLTRGAPSKKHRELAVLGPGDVFGEMALLEESERTATAVMIESGEIYLLYTTVLDRLTHQHPNTGTKIFKNMAMILSRHLRRTNKSIDENPS